MSSRRLPALATAVAMLTTSVANAQAIEGSLAAELSIDASGIAAQAVLRGSAGVGIPIPSVALGIAPGEPVLLVNNDLNVVAIAGGAIEDATGGVIPNGSAQNVIRTGLSGGDVVDALEREAVDIVARALDERSGGYIPASASRAVIQTALNGGDIGDALQRAAFDLVVDEAAKLIAGELGTAVSEFSRGFVTADTLGQLFSRAVRGQSLGPVFRQALRERFGQNGNNGNNNPAVIVNAAARAATP